MIKTCRECKRRYRTEGIFYCSMKCRKDYEAKQREEKKPKSNIRSDRYIKDRAAIDSGYF